MALRSKRLRKPRRGRMKMLRYFRRLLQLEESELNLLLYMRNEIMTKLDDLKSDIADYQAKVMAAVDGLQAAVEDLKTKVGTGVTDADIDAVIAQVDAAKAALEADVAPPAAPAV